MNTAFFLSLIFLMLGTLHSWQTYPQDRTCRDNIEPFKKYDNPFAIVKINGSYYVCAFKHKSVIMPGGPYNDGDLAYLGDPPEHGCTVACARNIYGEEACRNVCEFPSWLHNKETDSRMNIGGIFDWVQKEELVCLDPIEDACCPEIYPTVCPPDALWCKDDLCMKNLPKITGCLKCYCLGDVSDSYKYRAYYSYRPADAYHDGTLPGLYRYVLPDCDHISERGLYICCRENPADGYKHDDTCSQFLREDELHRSLESLYQQMDRICPEYDRNFLNCSGEVVTDENCCPVKCVQPPAPCDCEGLSANSTDGWKLDIQSDSKQDPHRALGVIPGIKVGGRKRLFIKRDDDSSFCLHSLYMKILCVKEVYIKINLDNGEVVKDTVEIDFPQEYEANLGPFDYNNVHSVRLGFKKWVDNCPSAHTYSLQLNTCDPSGN